jgi:hypothetical protein
MRSPSLLLLLALAAFSPGAHATTISVAPDEPILKAATGVGLATVVDVATTTRKCLATTAVTLALGEPIKRVRPTSKPVTLSFPTFHWEEGCPPEASYTIPPRASTLAKDAIIIVALLCTGDDACKVTGSWNAKERARIEAALVTLGVADRHDPDCLKARPAKVDEVRVGRDVPPGPKVAGVSLAWLGSGHKFDGPTFLEVAFTRGTERVEARAMSDDWSGWRRLERAGVCWRVVASADFDPREARLQLFALPAP